MSNPTKTIRPTKRGLGSKLVYKLKRFARYIGLYKRVIHMPDGVRYKERSGSSIRRALSEHGPGVKEFDVRFPWFDSDGRRGMRIRYTASRLYSDVGHDPRTVLYSQLLTDITPGLRVLEIGCGTGAGSAILAHAVGPSGGVVAIDRDGESVRFARQRHRSDHCGYELGWIETLDGENDGGFDAVIGVDVLREITSPHQREQTIIEIARVVASNRPLVLIGPDPTGLDDLLERFEARGFKRARQLARCPRSGWCGVLCTKPGQRDQSPPRDHHSPGSFHS